MNDKPIKKEKWLTVKMGEYKGNKCIVDPKASKKLKDGMISVKLSNETSFVIHKSLLK